MFFPVAGIAGYVPSSATFATKSFFVTANTLSRISLALSGLSLIGMIAAFATRTQKTTHNTLNRTSPALVVDEKNMPAGSRIAYVDIDSLEANYDYFKNKKADFARRQASMESELQRSAQQLQSQAESFQKKVQSGGFTSQAEVDAAGRNEMQSIVIRFHMRLYDYNLALACFN